MTDSGFVTVPGGSLHFEVDGDGPPLLLIHAGIANLRMWDPQVPALAASHRVIRYDTRGFGRTESEAVEFSNRADAIAVLDHVGVSAATLVGASRGGMIALDLALESPDRVDALVIVDGGIGGYESPAAVGEDEMWEEVEQKEEAKEWDWLADFETRWWIDGPGQPEDRVDPTLRTLVHGWILDNYRAEKEAGTPQPLRPPAGDRLDDLSVPTLVVVGDLDEPATVDSCGVLADRVGGRLEVFEGCAHLPNLEQPDLFTELLLEFLEGVTPR
jgi:pimeloyl-ACP methyl ester carboxylesterase